MVIDPIADMLTRIRNAGKSKHSFVEMPSSKVKVKIAEVLKKEGYIKDFELITDNKQGILKIALKYFSEKNNPYEVGNHSICSIERISKQGRRMYLKKKDIKKVYSGLGIAILSTSKGLMTDEEARNQNIGGEIICKVW